MEELKHIPRTILRYLYKMLTTNSVWIENWYSLSIGTQIKEIQNTFEVSTNVLVYSNLNIPCSEEPTTKYANVLIWAWAMHCSCKTNLRAWFSICTKLCGNSFTVSGSTVIIPDGGHKPSLCVRRSPGDSPAHPHSHVATARTTATQPNSKNYSYSPAWNSKYFLLKCINLQRCDTQLLFVDFVTTFRRYGQCNALFLISKAESMGKITSGFKNVYCGSAKSTIYHSRISIYQKPTSWFGRHVLPGRSWIRVRS